MCPIRPTTAEQNETRAINEGGKKGGKKKGGTTMKPAMAHIFA